MLIPLLLSLTAVAKPASYAKVLSVEGLVSAEPSHTNLAAGTELRAGDRVTVMSGSRMRFSLPNGIVAELGDHSEATFENDARGHTVLRISHGALLAVAGNDAPLDIRSGALRTHFHGRAIVFEARGGKPVFICACEGDVAATWGGGKAAVADHTAVLIYLDRAREVPTKPRAKDEAILKALRELL